MAIAHILGYPRIGPRRELKFALERHWRGESNDTDLAATVSRIQDESWRAQRAAGLDWLTAGDFSLYDPMLDMAADLGVVPRGSSLADYFLHARGGGETHALEMTKWFDTNYHYLVPTIDSRRPFAPDASRLVGEARRCSIISTSVKVAMVGPLTFLRLSKMRQKGADRLALLEPLAEAYAQILAELRRQGVQWVQLDEPSLVQEIDAKWLDAYGRAVKRLRASSPRLLLTSYFASLEPAPQQVSGWDVDGIHLDLVRAPGQLASWRSILPREWILSAGVVDGRNVWKNDLSLTIGALAAAHEEWGDRLWVGTSCSLLHVPVSLAGEEGMAPGVKARLAFAREKLDEVNAIARALKTGQRAEEASADKRTRGVTDAHGAIATAPALARPPYATRRDAQRRHLKLSALPTTTIGSFPQTGAIREARAALRRGDIDAARYDEAMRGEIRTAIERQESLGLDVLVHGEAERNDMVEFFGERLEGFAVTSNGWVQSYGSRCVKPPIIEGDVGRPRPMTVDLTAYAQSLTAQPVKGMLTGPITILKWSFPRGDLPPRDIAMQIALAIRAEVADLQEAGIRVIQIDEPALREAMPLKAGEWGGYLEWAVQAFRVAASSASASTQVHTHMCYSEFGDILPAIAAMDADVVTLEASRSEMDVLDAFRDFDYPNEVGPGIYDIHSPRVPDEREIAALLRKALEVIPPERLWINPDCGLKTRGWEETRRALANMVAAARTVRTELESSSVRNRSGPVG